MVKDYTNSVNSPDFVLTMEKNVQVSAASQSIWHFSLCNFKGKFYRQGRSSARVPKIMEKRMEDPQGL